MEIRTLKYFLAVADTGSLTKAAEILHTTQPNLTRQIKNLEFEIGQVLFQREQKRMILTEEGLFFKKRAEEIVNIYDKNEAAILNYKKDKEIGGTIYIGGAETYAFSIIAKVIKKIQKDYPLIKFDIHSGSIIETEEDIDKGLIDFGILLEPASITKYNTIRLPLYDTWGLLMRKDCPLAQKEFVEPNDFKDLPLLISRHIEDEIKNPVFDWINNKSLNIVCHYNLLYNASILVKEGVGCAICLEKLVSTDESSELTFRPLKPSLLSSLDIAYKKFQILSRPAIIFLDYLKKVIKNY